MHESYQSDKIKIVEYDKLLQTYEKPILWIAHQDFRYFDTFNMKAVNDKIKEHYLLKV